jgi:hypothetical protein
MMRLNAAALKGRPPAADTFSAGGWLALKTSASLSLVYVEHLPSRANAIGIANAYRIVGVEPYNHMGTRGRGMNEFDSAASSVSRIMDHSFKGSLSACFSVGMFAGVT